MLRNGWKSILYLNGLQVAQYAFIVIAAVIGIAVYGLYGVKSCTDGTDTSGFFLSFLLFAVKEYTKKYGRRSGCSESTPVVSADLAGSVFIKNSDSDNRDNTYNTKAQSEIQRN